MALLRSTEGVVAVDFRRPSWIGAERRAVLDGIHARLLPLLAQAGGATLPRPITVALRDASQQSFGDWRAALPRPCTVFAGPIEPDGGREGAIAFTPLLARRLVDLLLGGHGAITGIPLELTTLEQSVLGAWTGQFFTALADGYRDVVRIAPRALRFEDTPASLRWLDEFDRVYLLELSVMLGGEDDDPAGSSLAVCLPAPLLDGFLQAGAPGPRDIPAAGPPPRALIESHIRSARIPVVACLPGFQLAARDGAALSVGDLLETTQPFHGAVELHALGRRLLLATMGQQQGHVGLRIQAPVTSSVTTQRPLRRTRPR